MMRCMTDKRALVLLQRLTSTRWRNVFCRLDCAFGLTLGLLWYQRQVSLQCAQCGKKGIYIHPEEPGSRRKEARYEEVKLQDMSTNTPSEELRDAVFEGDADKVDALVDNGADVNFIDEESEWALVLWAVKFNHVKVLEALLRRGANVHVGDPTGNTALHKAAYLGHVECAQLLLQHGASIESHNKMRQTPLDLAEIFGKPEVTAILANGTQQS